MDLLGIKSNITTLLEHLPALSRSVVLIEHTLVQVHLLGIKLNTTTLLEHLPSLSRSVVLIEDARAT